MGVRQDPKAYPDRRGDLNLSKAEAALARAAQGVDTVEVVYKQARYSDCAIDMFTEFGPAA
jgi:hypothetical protein